MSEFIYYKEEDVEVERFYRVPKAFVENEKYRDELDSNMKFLYSILRDRYELSIKNNWVDKEGRVYCLYSRENLAEDMNISVRTVYKCIKKLEELNLMKEVQKGLGKPNFMYISKVEPMPVLRQANIAGQDKQILPTNELELSETEKSLKDNARTKDSRVVYIPFSKYLKTKDHVDKEKVNNINYFLTTYNEHFDKPHRELREEQWDQVVNSLLDVVDHNGHTIDVDYFELGYMIDRYFDTDFGDCDYSILHFNNERIKAILYYEVWDIAMDTEPAEVDYSKYIKSEPHLEDDEPITKKFTGEELEEMLSDTLGY